MAVNTAIPEAASGAQRSNHTRREASTTSNGAAWKPIPPRYGTLDPRFGVMDEGAKDDPLRSTPQVSDLQSEIPLDIAADDGLTDFGTHCVQHGRQGLVAIPVRAFVVREVGRPHHPLEADTVD